MAYSRFLNNTFSQEGDVCALASYATIVEYFSVEAINIDDVLTNYLDYSGITLYHAKGKMIEAKHKAISKQFHKFCRPKNLRSSKYIEQLHETNSLFTKKYCRIISCEAELSQISHKSLKSIYDEITNKDALALILYKVQDRFLHALTVGFDNDSNRYFYKDSDIPEVQFGDILQTLEIWEYLIFRDSSD
jgi:hypothetical protein